MNSFVQIEYEDLPKVEYRPFAVFNMGVSQLERALSLNFESDSDGLDYLRIAYLKLDSGDGVILQHHENSPEVGVELWLDMRKIAQAKSIVSELVSKLSIKGLDTTWIVGD